jgi:hypothetical protein
LTVCAVPLLVRTPDGDTLEALVCNCCGCTCARTNSPAARCLHRAGGLDPRLWSAPTEVPRSG